MTKETLVTVIESLEASRNTGLFPHFLNDLENMQEEFLDADLEYWVNAYHGDVSDWDDVEAYLDSLL